MSKPFERVNESNKEQDQEKILSKLMDLISRGYERLDEKVFESLLLEDENKENVPAQYNLFREYLKNKFGFTGDYHELYAETGTSIGASPISGTDYYLVFMAEDANYFGNRAPVFIQKGSGVADSLRKKLGK